MVLTRQANEEIVFPQLGIKVKLVKMTGDKVRIGVEAPRDIIVLRGELMTEEIGRQFQEAQNKKLEHVRS